MKLFRSFKQIAKDNTEIVNFFLDKPDLWAHIHPLKDAETLHQHINDVEKHFTKLTELNGLEQIIDKIINAFSINDAKLGTFIKEMFYLSIAFHDFGKINPNFQAERMKNELFSNDRTIKTGFEHSFISAYFFLIYTIDKIKPKEFDKEKRILLYKITFLFTIPVLKHHSGYIHKDYCFSEEKINSIQHLAKGFNVNISKIQLQALINFEKSDGQQNLNSEFIKIVNNNTYDLFTLFVLIKLNYSLLTASDYLATSHYMNNLVLESEDDFGLMTPDFKKRLFTNFDNNTLKPFNGELIKNINKYLQINPDTLSKSKENLNLLRQIMGAYVLGNIQKHQNEKVFYIEAPTGGGKTNMSMLAIRKLLELHPEINKVFYVFPFTTLITQTVTAIKETFGLKDYDIAQVHSKASFQEKEYDETDANYGKEKRNQIDNLFVHYPFTLITHIKFFDILKSNKKDTNYLLHRLANSIVVIDELQAYNPDHWDKIKYFIAHYAELFNIRFIIMSATLPKIDEIELSGYKPGKFVDLIPNGKQFLQNPNFSGRVKINTCLLEKHIVLGELSKIIIEKSKEYAENRKDKFKGSIYTIIELIFKKSASEFYDIIFHENDFFDEIFVLSGTILESRRKYIIDYLKDKQNRKKKILLITTQVVEAGVDIDMDLGFKNQSLVDSDEQLAGRINRNVEKENCELYLFKHDKPQRIYGKDLRYEEALKLSSGELKNILEIKAFDKIYKKVFGNISQTNRSAHKRGWNEYLDNIKRLDYKAVHQEFKLIETESASIYAPACISIQGYEGANNFSEKEISFLSKHQCIIEDNQVDGEKVWDLYSSIIENPNTDFLTKQTEMKILNGIISGFVFSVHINNLKKWFPLIENIDGNAEPGSDQYFKLRKDTLNNLYSLEGGINEKYLKEKTGILFEII